MAHEKRFPARALTPEENSELSQWLKEDGVDVRRYRSLNDLEVLADQFDDLDADDLILLFSQLAEPVQEGFNASEMEPWPFDYEGEIRRIEGIRDRLREHMAKRVHASVEVVFMTDRNSPFVDALPEKAKYIGLPVFPKMAHRGLVEWIKGHEEWIRSRRRIIMAYLSETADMGIASDSNPGLLAMEMVHPMERGGMEGLAPSIMDLMARIESGEKRTDEGALTEIKPEDDEELVASEDIHPPMILPNRRRIDPKETDEDLDDILLRAINHLRPFELTKKSAPGTRYDPEALSVFQNSQPIYELISSSDWNAGRDLESSAQMLGIQSLLRLQEVARKGVSKNRTPLITLHLGPGDGKIMDEFERNDPKPNLGITHHVGIARSLLYDLSDLLSRSLSPKTPEEERKVMELFGRRITHLLQRHYGDFGKLRIRLSSENDMTLLRKILEELAQNAEVQSYASGNKTTWGTTYRYADDKPEQLSAEELRLFQEFVDHPIDFLEKHYKTFFSPESEESLKKLLALKGRQMLYGNFEDLPSLLADKGPMITFAYSVKGFSHLENNDYGMAVNAVASRLLPGGIFIDDGMVESYTWYHRIQQLRVIQKHLGPEYKIYMIGDNVSPTSVVIHRGSKASNFQRERIQEVCRPDQKLVSLSKYEMVWPEAALHNRLIDHIKMRIVHRMVEGIKTKTLRRDCFQTWRQSCLKDIDPMFSDVFENFVSDWKSHRGIPKTGRIPRKHGKSIASNHNLRRILQLFTNESLPSSGPSGTLTKESGQDLDNFIDQVLWRYYHERRKPNT